LGDIFLFSDAGKDYIPDILFSYHYVQNPSAFIFITRIAMDDGTENTPSTGTHD